MAATDQARAEEVRSLCELVERVQAIARSHERVALDHLVATIGDRSYGPLLLVPGLVMLAPVIGDIPGVPVLMGLLVILVAGQLLLRRRHVWVPAWLARRSVSADKVHRTARWLRRPAALLDRWSRPRQAWVVRRAGASVAALACIAVAAATPVMEVVPFSANLAGLAITAFGLGLLAGDGLVTLAALAFSLATFGFLVYGLL